jgi:hypothetical protein
MNPLASHWLRLSLWLLVVAPAIAFAVALTSGIDFMTSLVITLYVWVLVCVALAMIALVGLIVRLISVGMRAIRR